MAQQCIYDPARSLHGYSDTTWNRIKDFVRTPTKGNFTNVVRNLGVDDTRMVNVRDADGKRFFGDNIRNIEDLDFSKGSIPANTVVRVPTKNGERFFVSNKLTTSNPARWYRDDATGQLRQHSDWDQINRNVTDFQQYTRDSDHLWRPVEAGETGSFLNIQNPARGEQPIQKVADEGIDAIEIDGKFQLIDESSQAVNPRFITEKPGRGATYTENVTAKPSDASIAEKAKEWGVPQRVAYSIAGGLAGSMADSDDEFGGTFWGGAIGLALGSPRVRTKIRGKFNRTDGKGRDLLDEMIISTTREEKILEKRELAYRKHYKGDPTDDEAVDRFLRDALELEQKKANGEPFWKPLFDNRLFRSGVGLLANMGGTGRKMLDVFKGTNGFENKPTQLYARWSTIQDRIFGSENAKEQFRQQQIDFIRSFRATENLTDEQAIQSFGASIYRLRTFGGAIGDDGTFTYTPSVAANRFYSDDIIRDIDQQLLQNPEARRAFDAVSQYFDEAYEEATGIINRTLRTEIDAIGVPQARGLLKEINESGLTFKQFKKANKDKAQQVDELIAGDWGNPALKDTHSKDIKRIKSLIEDKKRFEELKGRYIPQKFSQVKEATERRNWEQRNSQRLSDKTPEETKIEWERYKASRILELNNDKWKAYELSEDNLDVGVEYFSTRQDALARLRVLVQEIEDPTRRQIVETNMEDSFNLDNYLDVTTRQDGTSAYSLTTPDYFRNEDMFPNGLFFHQRADGSFYGRNVDAISNANRSFTMMNTMKKADFFDRPRKAEIPMEFKELDMEQLVKFYADDMGVRLTAIDNNMYDMNALEKYWIRPIREEMTGRIDPQRLETKLDEVRSWVAVMQNQRPERKIGINAEERTRIARETQTKARNDSLLNSAAKLVTAPFNWGTTFYSMFTPAILGPFVTSWKGIISEYKNAIFNPQELKTFTNEIEKMGAIQKKFESYAPEYRDQYKETLLGDPSSFRRKFADFADKTTEFTANLSIGRMIGIDPENLGIGRLLVGNMMDISGAEAGLVTMAAFRHIDDLVEQYKQLGDSRLGRQRLQRQFDGLGITNMDSYVKEHDNYNKVVNFMRGKGSVNDFTPEHYSQVASIVNSVVDQYHGRTKTSRPLLWMDNIWGRALSRYSVYAQNFGVQTVGSRIYQPLKDWSDLYRMNDESVSMFKLSYWASTGNDAKFREVFGDNWEEAYNDFPVDAVNNFYKVFAALGVGHAMMITRGGMLDLTGIATNELVGNDDYEAWRNVNKQLVLGKDADTGEDFTLGDIFDGSVEGFDLLKLFTSSLAGASRMGFGGRYAQIFSEDMKFTEGGIADMTPVTGFPNDVFNRVGGLLHDTPMSDVPKTAAREIADFALLRSTPFGTMFDARQGILNAVFKKPKNRGITFRDAETGIESDASFYDF